MITKNIPARDVEVGDKVLHYIRRENEELRPEEAHRIVSPALTMVVETVAAKAIGGYTGNVYLGFESGHVAEDLYPNQDIEVVIEP